MTVFRNSAESAVEVAKMDGKEVISELTLMLPMANSAITT